MAVFAPRSPTANTQGIRDLTDAVSRLQELYNRRKDVIIGRAHGAE